MRLDPFTPFNFIVELDGLIVGGFSQVEGVEGTIEVEEYVEGGRNDAPHKLLKGARWPNLFVLSRGMMEVDSMWRWFAATARGDIKRRSGAIVMLNAQRMPVNGWIFHGAVPVRWVGPSFDASRDSEVAYREDSSWSTWASSGRSGGSRPSGRSPAPRSSRSRGSMAEAHDTRAWQAGVDPALVTRLQRPLRRSAALACAWAREALARGKRGGLPLFASWAVRWGMNEAAVAGLRPIAVDASPFERAPVGVVELVIAAAQARLAPEVSRTAIVAVARNAATGEREATRGGAASVRPERSQREPRASWRAHGRHEDGPARAHEGRASDIAARGRT